MSSVAGELDSGESMDAEAGLESGELDSGESMDAEAGLESGELDSGESMDAEAGLESGELDSGESIDAEAGLEFGDLDFGESIDAEAELESDTLPSLSWAVSIGFSGRIPALSEHDRSAARMRTCFQCGSVNQSDSLISLDASIRSSLWKPPHDKKGFASNMCIRVVSSLDFGGQSLLTMIFHFLLAKEIVK
jgi:hypothetical protein